MEICYKKQLSIVACLYIGQLSVGYIAWTAPVIAKLKELDQTPLATAVSDSDGTWMASFSFLGAIIGAPISGWLSNSRGRKPTLLLGGVVSMACFLILVTAHQMWVMTLGRCLNGVGLAIILITNLTYIAEIASTNIRGILLTGTGVAGSFGVLLVYAIGPYVSYAKVMYTGFGLGLLFSAGTLFIPESPVFHVLKGREIEAKATLLSIGRLDDFQDILTTKHSKGIQDWKSVFSVKSNRRALLISTVLSACQEMSGALVITFYATSIFQAVESSIDPAVATIVVGVTQLLASCSSPLFVERVGRKVLIITSISVCFVCLMLLAVHFYLESIQKQLASELNWLPLVALMMFLISYQSGFGMIPMTCMSEMFDSSARGPGSALVFSVSMTIGFLVTATFGTMMTCLGGHVTFLLYAIACAFACVFASVFMIETKGRSLCEIQFLLGK